MSIHVASGSRGLKVGPILFQKTQSLYPPGWILQSWCQCTIAYLADSGSNSASKELTPRPTLALRAQTHLCEFIPRPTHWIPDLDLSQQTKEPAHSLADWRAIRIVLTVQKQDFDYHIIWPLQNPWTSWILKAFLRDMCKDWNKLLFFKCTDNRECMKNRIKIKKTWHS